MGVLSPNLTDDTTGRIQFALAEESAWPSSVIQFMDGKTVAILKSTKKLRAWTLVYENQTDAEFQSLKTFYDARKGPYTLFYFDHPIESELDIPVRFDWKAGTAMTWGWDTPTTRRVTFRIREVA